MKRIASAVVLLLPFVVFVSAQEKVESQPASIQTVDYCALRKTPELYNGKMIRVSGIYARGFEISAFYSRVCFEDQYRSRHETWVDRFYNAKISGNQDIAAIVKTFLSDQGDSELEVTLIGTFRGSKEHGGFGHLNGSRFQIEVSQIEEAKLLPDEVFGCQRVDRTKPFHYLSFERIGKGAPASYEKSKFPKRENLIYLRLANNSTCPLSVPTVDNADGTALKDKTEIPVIYDLQSSCVRVAGRSITQVKKTLSVLSPGNSIYFTIPLRFLTKEPYAIRIPFDSGTAKDSSYYQPFYFSRYDLPEDLRKDEDCTKY